MKKLFPISVIAFSLLMIACNQTTQNSADSANEATEQAADTEGMKSVDLSEYDIDANISLPDESKGEVDILATDWGSVEIRVGNRFGIEIVPYGMTVEEKKAEIEGDLVYQTNFIEESESLIVYERNIKDSEIEKEYHFFFNSESNGDLFEIKSLDEKYSKSAIELMVQSAKSFTVKKPA